MTDSFVHLRTHSEYSIVDGIVRIEPLLKRCADLGINYVAITEQNNLCSIVKIFKKAVSSNIKPILGVDLWLDLGDDNPCAITLLAMNAKGYLNLTELVAHSWLKGQKNGQVITQESWLLKRAEGLIALSGAQLGAIGRELSAGKKAEAAEIWRKWQPFFGDRFYIEIQRLGRNGEEAYIQAAAEFAHQFDLPLVATNSVCFLEPQDFDAHEARVAIGAGLTLDDPNRPRNHSPEQYFKTPAQMSELFSDLPESLANTVEIAKRCTVELTLTKNFLPNFVTPNGSLPEEYLKQSAQIGLAQRLKAQNIIDDGSYQERLEFELNTIIRMEFASYFLIVADFIAWAKNNDVPVGPGRGSGAGSLVAYALNITDLNPLTYDLLFERFLNPERISMPDFDVDFCMDGRDKVIDYVTQKYGSKAVGQIITFGSMAAKAVVRDVTRVLGKPYSLGDKLAKLIPFDVQMTLAKAREQEKALNELLNNDAEADEIWQLSLQLEGITRNSGKHAGGVVIAPTKLTDFCAISCDADGSNIITQFDKEDVELAGLVKFDFLGLRTLTIIKWAVQIIAEQGIELDISKIALDDKKVFAMLQKAETMAVFQLESRGMRDLVKRLKPDCLEDIIALVALFRPGPLGSGMVDDFINRKHGREAPSYPHPKYQLEILKPILASTYGVILYQEQVMKIAQVMAGYSLGQADVLRKVMGKKNAAEMTKQRDGFVSGSVDNGISAELASNIFDLIEKFAGYGFNKSHSAAYALVAYQTAWLKTHFPAPFMAAVLSAEMHNTDKVVIMLEECTRLGLTVLPPCVNRSNYKFSVTKNGQILYGLGAIKGIGEAPAEAIMAACKQHGSFSDIFDFCQKIDLKAINRRTIEALILSGAFDNLSSFNEAQSTSVKRALLLAAADDAMQTAEQKAQNASLGMRDLFGATSTPKKVDVYAKYLPIKEMSLSERLDGEKSTLGLYLTGHPLDDFMPDLQQIMSSKISDLNVSENEQIIAGMLAAHRTMRTKKGEKIGFITLDDKSGTLEIALFSKSYASSAHLLKNDAILVVQGIVEQDNYSGNLKMRANKILTLDEAQQKMVKTVFLKADQQDLTAANIAQISNILNQNKGSCPVVLQYCAQNAKVWLKFGANWQVMPSMALQKQLSAVLPPSNINFNYGTR